MKGKNGGGSKKQGAAGMTAIITALALAFLIYFGDEGTHYYMLPLIVFLTFALIRKIILCIFTGYIIKTLCSCLLWLAAGISASLFLMNAQGGWEISSTGIYTGWFVLSLLCLIAFYSSMKRAKSIASGLIQKEWKKHRQTVEYEPGQEYLKIKSYIEGFIDGAAKSDLLIAVIEEGLDRKLIYGQIGSIIGNFINYRDESIPAIITKRGKRRIENKNRARRKIIAADMMEKIRNTGVAGKL